jgi:hypothetical protein
MKTTNTQKGSAALWIIIAVVVVAGAGAYYYYTSSSNSNNSSSAQNSASSTNPFGTISNGTPTATENANAPVTTQSPTTGGQTNTATPRQASSLSSTASACDYLSAAEVGSVTGVAVQSRSVPMGAGTAGCLYTNTTGTYKVVADLGITTSLINAPDSAIAVGYQQFLKSGATPVQGIGDMAAETISSDSVFVFFWKDKIHGTITVSGQGGSIKSQAESLAKIVVGKL